MIPTAAEVRAGYYDDRFDTALPEPWDPREDDASYVAHEARQETWRDD